MKKFTVSTRWLPVFVWVGLPFILLSLPVTLPFIALHHTRLQRKKRASAAAFSCVRCGLPLGQAALDLSDRRWAEYMEAYRLQYPNTRLRIVRKTDAICIYCGQQYGFNERAGTFLHLSPEPHHRIAGESSPEDANAPQT